jgi:hypothetical protein
MKVKIGKQNYIITYMQNNYQKQNRNLRDAEIYEKYHISQRGVSFRKLAKQYPLTSQRIHQIVREVEKELGIPEKVIHFSPLDPIPDKLDNEDKSIINLFK